MNVAFDLYLTGLMGAFIVTAGQDFSGMLGSTFDLSGHVSLSEMLTVKCLPLYYLLF